MGEKRALIVLGHAVSEEPGMQWLVGWLQPKVPGINITHIPAQNPFTFM
jgi:putative NIF3 family GTP cyclohydrolase 1 type 2